MGFLMTFEGGEACGKTTAIKGFEDYLTQKGIKFTKSREPGGTELANELRQIVLNGKQTIGDLTEFLIFSSARCDHVEKVIRPALQRGELVVLDRYYDSSFAYQGYAGGLDTKEMKKITKSIVKGAVPDLTILLDISYEDAFARKAKDENLKNLDRIESKGREYHNKVRNGYLTLAKEEPNRFVVIDASQSKEKVLADIISAFERFFSTKK